MPRGLGEDNGGKCLLLELVTGEPEVFGAPVKVETDTSEVTGTCEAPDPLEILWEPSEKVWTVWTEWSGNVWTVLTGGDASVELVAEGVGLAGGLTVAAFSFESISIIFLPAMLWQSKFFLRSSTTLALMWTVPLMTPSVMVWTVWEILPRILSFWPP